MAEQLAFECDGAPSKIFGKIAKYLLLNVITLSIYRFWAKTNIRRYFWSSTKLDGEAFSYHGTGKELFIGFIIVLVAFILLYFVIDVIKLLLIGNLLLSVLGSVIVAGLFLFLFHFAIFSALRYRLSRTYWRGIRFYLHGKAIRYAVRGAILQIANIISLGLTYPWTKTYLVNYCLKRMLFGTQNFESSLTGNVLMKRYYLFLLPILFTALIIFASNHNELQNRSFSFGTDDIDVQISAIKFGFLIPFVAIYSLFALFAYKIFEVKAIISHLHFDKMRFNNNISVARILFKLLGLYLLFIGLVAVLYLISVFAIAPIVSLAPIAVVVFLPLVAFGFYFTIYFMRLSIFAFLARNFINHSSIEGVSSLKDVSAYKGADIPTRGEGLFEILDLGI